MSKLTVCRGVSGSGKSTWARAQPQAVVVSRDDLRVQFYGSDGADYYQNPALRTREDFITKAEHALIKAGLEAGQHVISDNTNIETKYIKPIVKIAREAGAEVEVKVFDVDASTAAQRNDARASAGGRDVPRRVIERQHSRLKQNKNWKPAEPVPAPEPYHGTPDKPMAVMVDIDGTLAHMNGKRGPFDWDKVGVDDLDVVIAELVKLLDLDYKIVIMSGRDGVSRAATEEWLKEHDVCYEALLMRAAGDMRADNIVKAELFDNHVRDHYDVQFVIDDRWQVCKMWLQMGLKVLNVSGLDRGEF